MRLIAIIVGIGFLIAAFEFVRQPQRKPKPLPPPPALSAEQVATIQEQTAELGVFTVEDLEAFEDNSVLLSAKEKQALFKGLHAINSIRNSTLDRIARSDVAHSVLMADPDVYRGQLIRLSGQVRRLTQHVVPKDAEGLQNLLEGWVFTPDSDINPYRIITWAADDVIPRGDSISPVNVEISALFVRVEPYASQGGTSRAPLMIAKRISALQVAPEAKADQITPFLTSALTASAIAIMGAFLMTLRRQKRRRLEFRIASSRESGPGEIDAELPADFLRNLELEEQPSDDLSNAAH